MCQTDRFQSPCFCPQEISCFSRWRFSLCVCVCVCVCSCVRRRAWRKSSWRGDLVHWSIEIKYTHLHRSLSMPSRWEWSSCRWDACHCQSNDYFTCSVTRYRSISWANRLIGNNGFPIRPNKKLTKCSTLSLFLMRRNIQSIRKSSTRQSDE